MSEEREPIIIVQGGAGNYSSLLNDDKTGIGSMKGEIEEGVVQAASTGYSHLREGGSALDAVVAAVSYMEDSALFNAGKGSYLTTDMSIEMDASVMDGSNLKVGSVVCIKNVAHPVQVARMVLDKSDHVMFTGDGANAFAARMGVERVDDDYLITEKALERIKNHPSFTPAMQAQFYDRGLEEGASKLSIYDDEHDTVGAVAMDKHGNLAYATSTGGVTAKQPGRVGDSPIPGCGGYADNLTGAVSTTGHGEAFIKTCMASKACFLMEFGVDIESAVKSSMDVMKERVGGVGGCIGVDKHGTPAICFTAEGMAWASISRDKVKFGILEGEETSCNYR